MAMKDFEGGRGDEVDGDDGEGKSRRVALEISAGGWKHPRSCFVEEQGEPFASKQAESGKRRIRRTNSETDFACVLSSTRRAVP